MRSVVGLSVLATCIGIGALSVRMLAAQRQAAAVKAIQQIGGIVTYDWEVDDTGTRIANVEEPSLDGWRAVLGLDFFYDVYQVQFPKDVTDDGVRHIKDVRTVRAVNLAYCFDISDQAIQYLTALPNLRVLELYANDPIERNNFVPIEFDLTKQGQITETSLEYIGRIRSLEELSLWDDDYSDRGIMQLSHLPELRYVFLRSSRVTEAGIARLQQALPNTIVDADIVSKRIND
ncbi:MAG TPA: hypothetical protein VMM76_07525 [Pirellulaceae bacterium]|nr:hypothetical protein [Pirellulaceae bacterium]